LEGQKGVKPVRGTQELLKYPTQGPRVGAFIERNDVLLKVKK
jgi:hypothetical protein